VRSVIDDDRVLTVGSIDFAEGASRMDAGTIVVSGGTWTQVAPDLVVGTSPARSELRLVGGAVAHVDGQLLIGDPAGDMGVVTVSGRGSALIAGEIIVGDFGTGSLVIELGAMVQGSIIGGQVDAQETTGVPR
jgi:T5SS/PEP-CTERM-associated repeat protein